jgi:hypothetical protein
VAATIGTNNWNHCKIEQEFKKVLAIWKEKEYHLDISEFCLMTIVQTAALLEW